MGMDSNAAKKKKERKKLFEVVFHLGPFDITNMRTILRLCVVVSDIQTCYCN